MFLVQLVAQFDIWIMSWRLSCLDGVFHVHMLHAHIQDYIFMVLFTTLRIMTSTSRRDYVTCGDIWQELVY